MEQQPKALSQNIITPEKMWGLIDNSEAIHPDFVNGYKEVIGQLSPDTKMMSLKYWDPAMRKYLTQFQELPPAPQLYVDFISGGTTDEKRFVSKALEMGANLVVLGRRYFNPETIITVNDISLEDMRDLPQILRLKRIKNDLPLAFGFDALVFGDFEIEMTDGLAIPLENEENDALNYAREVARRKEMPLIRKDKKTNPPASHGDHVPHWLIDTPNGPNSNGVCKHCGETKTFKNSFDEDYMWE